MNFEEIMCIFSQNIFITIWWCKLDYHYYYDEFPFTWHVL